MRSTEGTCSLLLELQSTNCAVNSLIPSGQRGESSSPKGWPGFPRCQIPDWERWTSSINLQVRALFLKHSQKINLHLGFSIDNTDSLGNETKPSGRWTPFLPHPIQRLHSLPSAFWQAAGWMCVLWQPLQASVPGCKPSNSHRLSLVPGLTAALPHVLSDV